MLQKFSWVFINPKTMRRILLLMGVLTALLALWITN